MPAHALASDDSHAEETRPDECRPAADPPSARELPRAWHALRMAIAEQLVQALPATINLSAVPRALGVSAERVQRAVLDGTIVTTGAGRRRRMVVAESREFLAYETSIRLPLPDHLRGTADAARIAFTVTLTVRPEVWRRMTGASAERELSLDALASEAITGRYGASRRRRTAP